MIDCVQKDINIKSWNCHVTRLRSSGGAEIVVFHDYKDLSLGLQVKVLNAT